MLDSLFIGYAAHQNNASRRWHGGRTRGGDGNTGSVTSSFLMKMDVERLRMITEAL